MPTPTTLINTTSEALLFITSDLTIVDLNPAAASILNATRDRLISKNLSQLDLKSDITTQLKSHPKQITLTINQQILSWRMLSSADGYIMINDQEAAINDTAT